MTLKIVVIGLLILLVLSGCVSAPAAGLNTKQVQAMIDDTLNKKLNALNMNTPAPATKPAAVASTPTPTPVNLKPIEDRLVKLEQAIPIFQADLANNKITTDQLNKVTQELKKIQTSLNALNTQIDAYANRGTVQINRLQVTIASPNQTLPNLVAAYPQSVPFLITITNTTTKILNNVNIVGFIRYDHALNMAPGYPQIATNDNTYQYLIANNINNQIQFNVVNGAGVIFPIPAGATITMQPRLILQTLKGSEYLGVVNFYISIYSISYD